MISPEVESVGVTATAKSVISNAFRQGNAASAGGRHAGLALSSAGRDQIAADEDEREQHQDEIEWSEGDELRTALVFYGRWAGIATREECLAVEHRGSDRDTTRASSAHNYAETAFA